MTPQGIKQRLLDMIAIRVAVQLEPDLAAINAQLSTICSRLSNIEGDLKEMPTQADLDAAIATVNTNINQLGTDLAKTIADLEAKITAAGTPIDLTSEIANLNAAATTLQGFDASTVAADPPATP